MKKILFATFSIVVFLTSEAQRQGVILNCYAYRQETMPGVQMEGQEVQVIASNFIYLEILKSTMIDIKYLWVGKKCSKPSILPVTKFPVAISNSNAMNLDKGTTELVPVTKNSVLQILQNDVTNDSKLTTGRRLAARYAFVIAYVYKGKWYYYTGKKIKELEKQYGM